VRCRSNFCSGGSRSAQAARTEPTALPPAQAATACSVSNLGVEYFVALATSTDRSFRLRSYASPKPR